MIYLPTSLRGGPITQIQMREGFVFELGNYRKSKAFDPKVNSRNQGYYE